jgi:Protein of unknown function (DUF3089)
MARKFLYVFAFLIGLVIVGGILAAMFPQQIARFAFTPKEEFKAPQPVIVNAYAKADMWIARPDIPENPALWRPAGVGEGETPTKYATFFIHPTSYLNSAHWNAPLDDAEANDRARLFVRGQASVFNASPNIWAPRYRQATFGAFLTNQPEARQAQEAAYDDVLQAFDYFMTQIPKSQPIVLAGHSQGSRHLAQLLVDRVNSRPLAKRIIAAYVVGWPLSPTADVPALGLPLCSKPDESGCILDWLSFAEPDEVVENLAMFEAAPSLTGMSRKGTGVVCVNPITGASNLAAEASANLGTLFNKPDFSDGDLRAGQVPAKCGPVGQLQIGEPPELGPYVLPGNNYHVYDYSLFWANIRADVITRAKAWKPR